MTLYDKGEAADLTAKEKKALKAAMERELEARAAKRAGRGRRLRGEIVAAFASFEALGAAVVSTSQRESFVAMIVAMRRDSGNASRARIEDVRQLLLGIKD